MALIEWRDEFRIGIASVDHEHERLIELINRLHANLSGARSKAVVADFLGEVYTKISAHFALEEKVMRDLDYDRYDEHKADHEELLDEIRDIMDAYEADQYFDYDEVLAEQLEAWFTVHFKTKDGRLHKFLAGRADASG
jgi:hemerythrin